MDVRELMIGNLVTIDNERNWPNLKNIPLMVAKIGEHDVSLDHINQLPNTFYRSYSQFIRYINPIEITPERLILLGFEEVYNSEFWRKFNHSCSYIGFDFSKTEDKKAEGFRYYGHYIKAQYVHQIQNLYFTLTGLELTVK